MDIAQLIKNATAHYKGGRLREAEEIYRCILSVNPNHGIANHNMGILVAQSGEPASALPFLKAALEAIPSEGLYWLSYSKGLLKATKPNDALAVLSQAKSKGLKGEAVDALRSEIEAQLSASTAHNGTDSLIVKFKKEISERPNDTVPIYNLGVALKEQGKLKEAALAFEKAIEMKPDFLQAINNLGFIMAKQGQISKAFGLAQRSIAIQETETSRSLIVLCLHSMNISSQSTPEIDTIRELLRRALAEGWERPSMLMNLALKLIRRDLSNNQELENGALLQCVLQLAPITEVSIERMLTTSRVGLLEITSDNIPTDNIAFYSALAQQCFINEYIYNLTSKEVTLVKNLKATIEEALKSNAAIDPLQLVCLASYIPLIKLSGNEKLPQMEWHPAIKKLIRNQVLNPSQELLLRESIHCLTKIDNEISVQVRDQYEEFPYPRWIKCFPGGQQSTLQARMRRQFPLAPFAKGRNTLAIDTLIAGCGTGRQSIECAKNYPKAKILAIDLSLTSLAYAQRMTNEEGINNIEYAQADLLKLGSLDKQFDLIESAGVLHHLHDPAEGWKVLLSLLRPGGFMRIGLYSELARKDAVAARKFIAEHGYSNTTEGIKQCRKAMTDWKGNADWKPILNSEDFYNTSSCRDLIFHVQEHRFTIPKIKSFLFESGLIFIGFDINPQTIASYHARFKDDPAGTNLRNWHDYEIDNPNIFKGMYQFYVQKPE